SPLRAIEGFSKALEQDYAGELDEQALHYISRIRSGTVRMSAIIDDLLKLSRVSRAELNLGNVDISTMCRGLAREISEQHPQRRIRWEIEPGLVAWADRQLISVMLANLLGNAGKFSAMRDPAIISVRRLPGS